MKRLENKVAIVTGAAGGIGAAVARIFAKEGAKVLITDVQQEKLSAVANEILAEDGVVAYMTQDVSTEDGWKSVTEKAVTLYGDINILINNAGISGNIISTFEERTIEEFNKIIAVNLLSQFLGTKSVIPFMKKNNSGSIVNVSSIGGIIGSANATAYTASKGGSRSYTKGAAAELAPFNIRVNSVHPGYIATPMTKDLPEAKEFERIAVGATPLGRGGTSEEIAYGILYLASDESSFTTGIELIIDGGTTAL
ncbi:SDR family NAD(P)-dependent oxidoreductase [Pedobacter kyonggii]|uniref:Glucose 1-dehydrogenase n=1 Tax=Pedobacter kyonggii TaxID=1926871 RepID=A0A4Q9HGQ8_9SPHI|nr:glucose 1-dehydrogenase [Pedobacter kyonggii]TBO44452.1 glucose 1-dehydrogenase [Pedobacter kyonggii]